jgi:ribosome-associated heat shock protein Hsp15
VRSGGASAPSGRRLDQWLWFARFVKTRSLAARLCTTGAITLNGAAVHKANQLVRVGDTIAVPRGAFFRTIRVSALGVRRGPAPEARLLYEEITAPVHKSELDAEWTPLLVGQDEPQNDSLITLQQFHKEASSRP